MFEKVNLNEFFMVNMILLIVSFLVENDKLKEENIRLNLLSNEFEKDKEEYEKKYNVIVSEN